MKLKENFRNASSEKILNAAPQKCEIMQFPQRKTFEYIFYVFWGHSRIRTWGSRTSLFLARELGFSGCGLRCAKRVPFVWATCTNFAWCNGLNWHSEWCRPGRLVNVITEISVIASAITKQNIKFKTAWKEQFTDMNIDELRDKKISHVSEMARVAVGSIASCRHRMTSRIKSACSSQKITQVWYPAPWFKMNFTLLLVTFSDWWAEKHLCWS